MEKKIKQVLINNMELFDEVIGLMGIPDEDTKLEIIAQDIVKLFAISDVNNLVCPTHGTKLYKHSNGMAYCSLCDYIQDSTGELKY